MKPFYILLQEGFIFAAMPKYCPKWASKVMFQRIKLTMTTNHHLMAAFVTTSVWVCSNTNHIDHTHLICGVCITSSGGWPVSRCASNVTATFWVPFSKRKRIAKQNPNQISLIKTSNETKQEMQTKIKREKLIRAGVFLNWLQKN